jgi:hypothetical protein
VSVLHRQHDFYPARAFLAAPGRLALLLGPGMLLVPWALMRRRSPGLVYATALAVAGVGATCVGFGTQWAFSNAFLPGVFFSALAIGVAAGRLATVTAPQTPPRRPAAVYLLLVVTLACAPGVLLSFTARIAPSSWGLDPQTPTGYRLQPLIPRARDRAAGDALLRRLASVDGEVLIPFHPFYAYLVGKRVYLHRMGVLDIWRASMGPPRGLTEALAAQRFALVVMDDRIDGNWHLWPGLLEHYHAVEEIDGPRVPSGAPTHPRYLLRPNSPAMTDPKTVHGELVEP